ncbi:MAG: pilin [Deltaproteobacteria bacterium]|nr:pilin [Deltaproteobacteria bacterium]
MSGVVHAMGGLKNAVVAYLNEKGTDNASAADVNAIKNIYGFDFPLQYANAVSVNVQNDSVTITATVSNIPGVNGTLVLSTTNWQDASAWTWNQSTVPEKFRPKQ